MKIDACIFDLDGTLLYTIDTIHFYVNKTLADMGLGGVEKSTVQSYVGNGSRDLISRVLAKLGYSDPLLCSKVHETYLALYNSDPCYLTKPYDGIVDMLHRLKKMGVRLAVWSNKPESSVVPIVEQFFPDCFSLVRGGLPNMPLKPDPTLGFDIIEKLYTTPSHAAFVGDMKIDCDTARALGTALCVGVSWGFGKAGELDGFDAVVYSSEALLSVLSGGRV